MDVTYFCSPCPPPPTTILLERLPPLTTFRSEAESRGETPRGGATFFINTIYCQSSNTLVPSPHRWVIRFYQHDLCKECKKEEARRKEV
jgi:hypothetical protein